MLAAQLCLTLCDTMDCSPSGSSFHGILQARSLEWVAISVSRGSSRPRDWTRISCTAGGFFTTEIMYLKYGLPWWLRWERICLQCRIPKFDSWVGKMAWRREWLPTWVFLPGQFHGQRRLTGTVHGVTQRSFFAFYFLKKKRKKAMMKIHKYDYNLWFCWMAF